jgi:glycosyltransferase involved in cell wall biosynthesis
MTDVHLKIVVPCYNAEKWVGRCLNSVFEQTYTRWDLIIINDVSTDNTLKVINDTMPKTSNNKIIIKNNPVNVGALANIVNGIDILCDHPEDVIVLLDGDDWLAHNKVFELIYNMYQDLNTWLTYGQYANLSNNYRGICAHLTSTERYRKYRRWVTSHLRTFKKKMWDKIKNRDLRNKNGEYYSMTWDLAIMFPLIEMCGLNRIKYIKEILYIYNDLNPLNDHHKNAKLQLTIEDEIRAKEAYQEIK